MKILKFVAVAIGTALLSTPATAEPLNIPIGNKYGFTLTNGKTINVQYDGETPKGHKFSSSRLIVFLGKNVPDVVRVESGSKVFTFRNAQSAGTLSGGPSSTWDVDYDNNGARRSGSCVSEDIQFGRYKISCDTRLSGRSHGLQIVSTVDLATGLWMQERVDQSNGKSTDVGFVSFFK